MNPVAPLSAQTAAVWRWLLTDHPRVRGRTAMSLMATVLVLFYTALVLWISHLASAPLGPGLWLWAGTTLLGQLALTWTVRSGRTLHLQDPALTGLHVGCSLSSAIASTLLSPDALDMLPFVAPLCLLLGSPGLRKPQLVGLTLYALVISSLAMLAGPYLNQRAATHSDLVHLIVLTAALLSSMAVGLRMYTVRMQLLAQRQQLMQELEEHRNLASRDPLTGLINRRSMLELLHLEQRRCLRGHRRMAIALLDLDFFKRINDTYGHAVGDQALQHFADVVRIQVRSGDVLSRWGGEEFVLMLCDIDEAGAQALLERVSSAVASTPLYTSQGARIALTVSGGYSIHIPGESAEVTLERADQALYAAKEHGRNQVCRAAAPPHPSPHAQPAPQEEPATID